MSKRGFEYAGDHWLCAVWTLGDRRDKMGISSWKQAIILVSQERRRGEYKVIRSEKNLLPLKRWNWRRFSADSIAYILYAVISGWIIPLYEGYFCELSIGRVAELRIMSSAPRVILACFFCGSLEDIIKRRLFGGRGNFWREAAAGSVALCVFQLPWYLLTAFFMRASWYQTVITSLLYIASDMAFGWSYVYLLHRMRRSFHAPCDL